MFTVNERVKTQKITKKPVRPGMKLTIDTGVEIKKFEVLSSNQGVLVAKNIEDPLNIIATQDLETIFTIPELKAVKTKAVTVKAYNIVYDVQKVRESYKYNMKKEGWDDVRQTPSIGFEDTIFTADDKVFQVNVVAVNESQLVVQESVSNDFIIFNNANSATFKGDEVALREIDWE